MKTSPGAEKHELTVDMDGCVICPLVLAAVTRRLEMVAARGASDDERLCHCHAWRTDSLTEPDRLWSVWAPAQRRWSASEAS